MIQENKQGCWYRMPSGNLTFIISGRRSYVGLGETRRRKRERYCKSSPFLTYDTLFEVLQRTRLLASSSESLCLKLKFIPRLPKIPESHHFWHPGRFGASGWGIVGSLKAWQKLSCTVQLAKASFTGFPISWTRKRGDHGPCCTCLSFLKPSNIGYLLVTFCILVQPGVWHTYHGHEHLE